VRARSQGLVARNEHLGMGFWVITPEGDELLELIA
jgi:hypothetical protein